jgi:tetratricopeptide (TPR) repeat protein
MKQLLVIAAIAAASTTAYQHGVKAVQAKDYATAIDQLQRALAVTPTEASNYVPHFWLGIARYETHDYDGALRDWKASEDQGVVQGTEYYSRMREFVAQAQRAKAEAAHSAVAEPRKNADAAMSRAMSAQMEAVGAGGDRFDSYRTGKRKLEQALADFNRAGNDAQAYQRAAEGANQARELFSTAADEAKRAKAAAAAKPKPKPVVQPPPQVTLEASKPISVPKLDPAAAPPKPVPVPIESEASVEARIREQQERAKAIMSKPKPAIVIAEAPRLNPIEPAYRAFARGDLARSEQLLNALLSQKPTAEAFLLRGCTRYTRAMLSRVSAPLLANATADFREAVKLNRTARLDKSAFSPKLVAFFEQARAAR